jgi:hypothetical protein
MTEPREDRIVAEGVHKAFGENEVLKGVSFSVVQAQRPPSSVRRVGKDDAAAGAHRSDVADAGVIRVGEVEVDSPPVSKDQLRRYRAQSGWCSGTTYFRTRRCCRTPPRVDRRAEASQGGGGTGARTAAAGRPGR